MAIAVILAVATASVNAAGWQGFTVSVAPSSVGDGTSPTWAGGITTDLGGAGTDIWSNNHIYNSEALIDVATSNPTAKTATDYGASGFIDTHGIAFSDIDGDGDEDLLEVMGRQNDNRLFKNTNGVLAPLSAGNLVDNIGRGRQPLFFDFNGDGYVDVLITNLDLRDPPVNSPTNSPSTIYLNDGTGTIWTPVANPSQILYDGNLRIAQQTSTGPATPQIVITHNSFTAATDSIATGFSTIQNATTPATIRSTITNVRDVALGDFDGDLHPELVVARGNESVSAGGWPMQIFDLVEGGSPVATPALPTNSLIDNCRSVASGDFDNDGDLDIFGGCSQKQESQDRNIVLLNDGAGNFTIAGTDVLPGTAAETAGGLAVADLDGDGWLDVWVGNGYDSETAADNLLMNNGGTSNHFVSVNLHGSNPDAAGAQVFTGTTFWQVRETGHRTRRGQDQRALHFGLGSASAIAPLEIMWPDGTFESCTVAGIDQQVEVHQGGAGCVTRTKTEFLATLAASPVVGEQAVVPGLSVLSGPCVVYDTPSATAIGLDGTMSGGETRTVQVTGTLTGQGGAASCVPVGVSSVVFRISSVDPLTEGNLLMTPAGVASTGSAGVVNYGAGNGLNNANTVTVPVSAAGAVDVGANAGPLGAVPTTDVRLVAVGFYSPEVVPELKFFAVNPCAVADSRTNQGASAVFNGPANNGLWPVNGAFPDIDVVGVFDAGQGGGNGVTGCGVPAGADAVMVNVVAVNMVGGSGHLSVGTGGSDPINEATTPFAVLTPKMNNGATTIVNLNGGQTIALDIDGNALASTMIRVEILGYYDQDVAGLDFVDVTPCAVFDTRSNKGATGGFAGERLNGLANTTTYQIAGRSVPVGQGGIVDTGGGTGTCGVPDGASAVLINLEAVNAVREGNFWVSATGTTTTGGVLNFNNVTPKMNNANAVVVPLSTAGQLDLEVNAGTFTPDGTPVAQARGVILGYYQTGRTDFDPAELTEFLPELPRNSQVKNVWQVDFNCYNDSDDTWFAKLPDVHTEINIGFGNTWVNAEIKPTIRNPVNNERVGQLNPVFNDLVKSDGTSSTARIVINGTIGCYARDVTPATAVGSLLHDYMWFDIVSGFIADGPLDVHIDNIPNGTYAVLFITSDDASHQREYAVSGEGFDVDVPWAPNSNSVAASSTLSPQFTVADGSIDTTWRRNNADRDGSPSGMIVIQYN